jgi:hypothetical protein
MTTAFISYVKEDIEKARELYHFLNENGCKVWLDELSLVPGQLWENEIRNAIKSCSVFIACLSSRSVNKKGVFQKELKYALEVFLEYPEGQIYLVPLRFDNCVVPERFEQIQYLDWFCQESRWKLLESIRSSLNAKNPENNISGVWESTFGEVTLSQDGDMIFGEYSYQILAPYSRRFGKINGKIVVDKAIFQWMETNNMSGVGFWSIKKHNKLEGIWWPEFEKPSYIECLTNPVILDGLKILEHRVWNMRKKELSNGHNNL